MNDYHRQGNVLLRTVLVSEKMGLVFRALDVQKQRTGVHARVEIAVNGVVLAWGVINTDKDEDRVRIGNSASRQLNGNGRGEVYPGSYLKKDLDDFCRGLWEAELGRFDIGPKGGLPAAPPDAMLKPFIMRGGGTICFAPPGRGKSWTTYLWAVSLDAGVSRLWPVHQSRVLLVNLERSEQSVLQRIGAVNQALGLPRHRTLDILTARGRSLDDVLPSVERYVQTERIDLVLLDSLSRAGMGDLNDNQPATRITDRLNAVCPTWVAIGHTPRANDEHVFGSMHFEAAADVLVKLSSQQDQHGGTLGIGLEITKGNDLPRSWFKLQTLALEMDEEQGLVGVRPGRPGEFAEIESGRRMSAVERLTEWMLDQPLARADAGEAADATGLNRTTVVRLFQDRQRFVPLGKDGRRALYGVKGNT